MRDQNSVSVSGTEMKVQSRPVGGSIRGLTGVHQESVKRSIERSFRGSSGIRWDLSGIRQGPSGGILGSVRGSLGVYPL